MVDVLEWQRLIDTIRVRPVHLLYLDVPHRDMPIKHAQLFHRFCFFFFVSLFDPVSDVLSDGLGHDGAIGRRVGLHALENAPVEGLDGEFLQLLHVSCVDIINLILLI